MTAANSSTKPLTPTRAAAVTLPNFRNLGVLLRMAVIVEALAFITAWAYASHLTEALDLLLRGGALREMVLLSGMLILFALSPNLARLPYRLGALLVVSLVVALAVAWSLLFDAFYPDGYVADLARTASLSALTATALLGYFNWRHRVLSPALAESRLSALQARIQPHFLFNSLNTVLGLLREQPRQAEKVLQGLADLFRAIIVQPPGLVALGGELALARAYIEIESLRLGSRLTVKWECDHAPLDALLPPMILQPLLENAVYHGIEPAEAGGEIKVGLFLLDGRLNLVVRNPMPPSHRRKSGNRMALTNIRERLELSFDADMDMNALAVGDGFVVHIRLPYRNGRPAENLHRR